MITLTASTVTQLLAAVPFDRYVMVSSDSTTITRLNQEKVGLETSTTGIILTAYFPLVIHVPAGLKLYAISSGTPNIGIQDISNPVNIVELR